MESNKQSGGSFEVQSGNAFVLPAVRAVVTTAAARSGSGTMSATAAYDDREPVTEADVVRIVCRLLADMRVYVAEEEITQAQRQVRDLVEESYF